MLPLLLAALHLACDGGTSPPSPPAILEIDPAELMIQRSDTLRLTAVARDAGARPLAAVPVVWASSDTSVATIDPSGLLTGLAIGQATITVSTGAVQGTALVRVRARDPVACTAAGTPHAGVIETDELWTAAAGPHHVTSDVRVETRPGASPATATLRIERGARICMHPGTAIIIRHGGLLHARGSAEEPVIITAADGRTRWRGIDIGYYGGLGPTANDTSYVTNAVIEDARWLASLGLFALDSVHVRARAGVVGPELQQRRDGGVSIQSSGGRISRSLVEDGMVKLDGSAGVASFEDTRILRGNLVLGRGWVRLVGARIEDSPGIGVASDGGKRTSDLTIFVELEPIRVVGAASYPAKLPLDGAGELLAIPGAQDSLLGNGRDTLIVGGASARGQQLLVRRELPWRTERLTYADGPYFEGAFLTGGAVLRLEPGASLTGHVTGWPGRLLAVGTPEAPVVLRHGTVRLRGTSGDSSRIEHARLENVMVEAAEQHPIILDRLVADGGTIALAAPGSRIHSARLMPTLNHLYTAGLTLGAASVSAREVAITGATGDAIRITAPGVHLSRCRITDNAGDGVEIAVQMAGLPTDVLITGCDLVNNGGFGIRNLTTAPVHAPLNWWGDPAGPFGPAGDGVAGPVDYSPFSSTPVSGDLRIP